MERQRFSYGLGLLCFVLLCCFSCEKPVGEDDAEAKDMVRLTVNIGSNYAQVPFGMKRQGEMKPIGELCTRLDVALFEGNSKVRTLSMERKDDSFGHFELKMAKGVYTLVILGHRGDGAATITRPDSIRFYKNKITDTFYACRRLNVTGDSSLTVDLERAVAAFRLDIEDATPADVKVMEFHYTGGSSTLDAVAGVGCVNSRQTEDFNVEAGAYEGKSSYTIFTFPRANSDKLKVTVTALDKDKRKIAEKEFDDVPAVVKQKYVFTGNFFSSGDGGDSFIIRGNDEWAEKHQTY